MITCQATKKCTTLEQDEQPSKPVRVVSESENREVHEVVMTNTKDNESTNHYKPHVDSNALTEIQEKFKELFK